MLISGLFYPMTPGKTLKIFFNLNLDNSHVIIFHFGKVLDYRYKTVH